METKAKGLTVLVIIVAVATCALAASASASLDNHSSGTDTGWMEQYAPYEEITSLRDYCVKHFDLGNGERIAVVGQGLLHYYDGEKFEDIPDLPFPEGIELVDEKDEHYIMSFPDWCTARVEDEGSVVRCYDKKNTSIYEFKDLIVVANGVSPYKKIVGSDGEEKTVIDEEKVDYCRFKVIDNKMYLVVPENLSNTYPLQAYDDVDTSATNNKDSLLDEGAPNDPYGAEDRLFVYATDSARARIVMDWTLPGGTGDISAIKLFLYKCETSGTSSYNVEVHEILESFVESDVTWNESSSGVSWTNAGCGSPNSSSATIVDSIPRTTSFNEWHNWWLVGSGADSPMSITWGSNFDITLRESAVTTTANCEDFYPKEYAIDTSLRPYIEITYSPPPPPSPSAPFMIYGWVFYKNGTACDNPVVNITNSNTSKQWQAETNVNHSYYRLILDTTNISVGNVLEFNAASPNGNQTNVTEHTVTQEEVNAGGFEFNITLASSANIVINEFVANPSSGSDWVELYNPAGSDRSLDGWTLNDSLTTSQIKSLSGTINASGYRVFEVSNRLDQDGDTITLLNGTTIVDEVTYGAAEGNAPVPTTGNSTGRYPNGVDTGNDSADFCVFDSPTRGARNGVSEDTTAPTSITGLDNTTYEQTYINWTWTDPADADFSYVKVYLDGNFKTDVLKGVRFYNATGLTHNTTYEISTHTVDESGNINATWVNHTARTNTSPYITPVSVEIGDYDMLPSPSGTLTAPIMLQNITGYGTANIMTLEYNESVVHITNVANGSLSTVVAHNIDNTTGTVIIAAWNITGVDGDIEFARITFEAVGDDGDTTPLILSVQKLIDTGYASLPHQINNGSITLMNGTPPVISNENATPDKIIQTNLSGRDRNVSRNTTTLSVNVTDTGGSGVKNVTINLTSIGGSANTSMTNGGSGDIYSVDTTATDGINLTHNLVVTAMDNNNNTATSNITLEVLRRGDVARNDKVDIGDALYIARYTVGIEPPADNWLLVGDVVGEGGNEPGDDSVDMGDALFISRRTVGLEEEEP